MLHMGSPQIKEYHKFDFKQIEPILRTMAILLLLFAAFHLTELSNFTLNIDDEYQAFSHDPARWLEAGRWTPYLFELLGLEDPVLPFFPLALFGLFCSIGYLLFLRAIGEGYSNPLSLAFFPLFAAFPTWAFLTAFRPNTPAAGLGIAFSCWAALLFRQQRENVIEAVIRVRDIWPIVTAGFLGAVAIGCYQSFFAFLVVALCASMISMSLAGRAARLMAIDCAVMLAILGFSLFLYSVILKFFLVLSAQHIGSYIQIYIRIDDLIAHPAQILSQLLNQMMDIYLGRKSIYGYESPVIILLVLVAATGIVHRAYRLGGARGSFIAVLSIFTLLALPFGMNLISGGSMPPRSLVAVPVVLASLGLLGFKYGPRWLSRIGLIILVLVFFCILKSLSGFNATRELVQLHDRQLAMALSERIAHVVDSAKSSKPLTLDVFGFQSFHTPYPRVNESTIGTSFFEWDRGNPYRMVYYMKLIGLPVFNVVRPERRFELLDQFVAMPSWPAMGSVRTARDGTILVKLGEEPNPLYSQLLATKDPSSRPDDEPFYRMSTAEASSWSVLNVSVAHRSSEGLVLDTGSDPQLVFRTGALPIVKGCGRIELSTKLRVEKPSKVQVFYKKPEQTEFTGDMTIATEIVPPANGGFVELNFQMISREGFADSFRLDPVEDYQRVTIREIELFCRYPKPRGG